MEDKIKAAPACMFGGVNNVNYIKTLRYVEMPASSV